MLTGIFSLGMGTNLGEEKLKKTKTAAILDPFSLDTTKPPAAYVFIECVTIT